MKTSIRKFLLVNLLLSLSITTLLTVLGNYFLGQKDIQAHVNSLNPQPVIPYTLLAGGHSEMDLKGHAASTHALGWQIIIDDLYIMLITFPLSGLLIWIIIGRGLDSISRVTVEVSNRAPSHLEPVRLQDVPDEIRPLIEELNHLFTRLRRGFEREKRFAADAAHELKTPLAAIKAQAQVALNAPTIEEKNASLMKLLASVQRGTHIVQQLLMMSTLASTDTNLVEWEKVDLVRAVREVLAMLASTALERSVDLVLEPEQDTLFIKGNATALAILFRNLIDNAIRYSPEKTMVKLSIFVENGQTIVEIDDCGPGIPDELHERVFERFFRILGNQSTGSGLGLAIVRQICDMHQAKIKFKKPHDRSGLIVQVSFSSSANT
jgi:two-component system, OmpR family, sensor histidine kinase QseC